MGDGGSGASLAEMGLTQKELGIVDTRQPVYKAIFEGVYDQIRQSAFGKTQAEKGRNIKVCANAY